MYVNHGKIPRDHWAGGGSGGDYDLRPYGRRERDHRGSGYKEENVPFVSGISDAHVCQDGTRRYPHEMLRNIAGLGFREGVFK